MKQFNLDTWLKDKSRKVVTRDGRPVRIICTDIISHFPIVAAIKLEVGNEFIKEYDLKGRACLSKNDDCDLFFADEEEELTEFESKLADLLVYNHPMDIECAESIAKRKSKQLLDLARKEILKEFKCREELSYKNGFEIGRESILKDLPKWKKSEKDEELDCHVAIQQNDRVVLSDFIQKDEYYITLDVLKKLPKEE